MWISTQYCDTQQYFRSVWILKSFSSCFNHVLYNAKTKGSIFAMHKAGLSIAPGVLVLVQGKWLFPRLRQVAIFVDRHESDWVAQYIHGGNKQCVCNFGVIFEVDLCLRCFHGFSGQYRTWADLFQIPQAGLVDAFYPTYVKHQNNNSECNFLI